MTRMSMVPIPGISNSLAAGIVYAIAIGFAIYYLWQTHKMERNLKIEQEEKKEK